MTIRCNDKFSYIHKTAIAINIKILFFLGNGTVLYLYSKESTLHSPSNLLVVNLALSDFVMIISNFPFFAYNCFNGGTWSFSQNYCALYAALGKNFIKT